MLKLLLTLTLAVPVAPVLVDPLDNGWVSAHPAFTIDDFLYADDAGLPPESLRLEFRAADGGYGALNETHLYAGIVNSTTVLPGEGNLWCWRASVSNTHGQFSAPSNERCFRTDFTPPVQGAVDAGAIVSNGRVPIDVLAGTDALSGIKGYGLYVGLADWSDYDDFVFPEASLPLVAFLGEGDWLGWVLVGDRAGNTNGANVGDVRIPITITAVNSVPRPPAPAWDSPTYSGYGNALNWDALWTADAGAKYVVASFCDLDAGCTVWHHGFHTRDATLDARAWLQTGNEGVFVARIAVVVGGRVGPWSLESAPTVIDRTEPSPPSGLMVSPMAARAGPLTVSWTSGVDALAGLEVTHVLETELVSGAQRTLDVPAPGSSLVVNPVGEGRFQYSARAQDRAKNVSISSGSAVGVIDATGPVSSAPVAVAAAADGGALITLTWSAPVDALSSVATVELEERANDGGTQAMGVMGLATTRFVPNGAWTWAIRGTDSLRNVGAYSAASNLVVVSSAGVATGPSITTAALPDATCGVPYAVTLMGSGDAPLVWTLENGPTDLTLDLSGTLHWTPPANLASMEPVGARLSNGVGTITQSWTLNVRCAAAVDAGSDAGGAVETDAGPEPVRNLAVGCGCNTLDFVSIALGLILLGRRRR